MALTPTAPPNPSRALELARVTAAEDTRRRGEASDPWNIGTSPLTACSSALSPQSATAAPALMPSLTESASALLDASAPSLDTSASALLASAPSPPDSVPPASPIEAPLAVPESAPEPTSDPAPAETQRPQQDEWGIFDPNQCGFAALFAQLDDPSSTPDKR